MKEVRKLYLFTLFRSLSFFAPISVAFYRDNLLTFSQIMILQSIYAIATAVLEIPSGMLSDCLGRKKTLILGTCTFFAAYMCGFIGTNWSAFAVMQIFAAIGQSCYSGTFVALMYENVTRDKSINKSVNVIFANMQAINICAVLAASFLCSLIVKLASMRITYLFTAAAYAVTLLVCILFKDYSTTEKFSDSLKKYASTFTNATKYLKKNEVLFLTADIAIFACFANVFSYLQQPLMLSAGIEVSAFGLIIGIITLCTVFALKSISFVERKVRNMNLFIHILTCLTICTVTLNCVVKNAVYCVFSLIISTITIRYREVFLTNGINEHINNSERATFLSFISCIEMIGIAIINIIVGYIEDKSISMALAFLSGVTVVMLICCFITKKCINASSNSD